MQIRPVTARSADGKSVQVQNYEKRAGFFDFDNLFDAVEAVMFANNMEVGDSSSHLRLGFAPHNASGSSNSAYHNVSKKLAPSSNNGSNNNATTTSTSTNNPSTSSDTSDNVSNSNNDNQNGDEQTYEHNNEESNRDDEPPVNNNEDSNYQEPNHQEEIGLAEQVVDDAYAGQKRSREED